ncbi:ribbon-helix-helix domain-containing protein [Rhodoplanes roseus]|uniref:Ribbon-helix-helix domain-containing protein n=1 Tax=Rhodoplanes roseus TaxID=29409 RepID=A0A327L0G6_9BRAD|nr:ribbon-helix-helix domain-containing protein [Rhodoplanes roseus]RAI43951.1 hypothetical protein CH341_11560 [Rhodoplanes roseus]
MKDNQGGSNSRGEELASSHVKKRSVIIAGQKTSVSLEHLFWISLKEIADKRKLTISILMSEIDEQRMTANLSSACRVHVLRFYKEQRPSADGDPGSELT